MGREEVRRVEALSRRTRGRRAGARQRLRAGPARRRENGRRVAAGMLGLPGAGRAGPEGIRGPGRRPGGPARARRADRGRPQRARLRGRVHRRHPRRRADRRASSPAPASSSRTGRSARPNFSSAKPAVSICTTRRRPRRRRLPVVSRALDSAGKLMPVTRDTWLRRRLRVAAPHGSIGGRRWRKLTERFEYAVKRPVFGCQACGNCVLGHMEYVCPQTCPKQMRNGPCGGTLFTRCEVIDQECIWVSVYQRAEAARPRRGAEDVHSGARSAAAGHELVDQLFPGPRQPPREGQDLGLGRRLSGTG